jgi:integrase
MVLLSMLAYAIECSDESGLTAMPCKIKLAKVDAQKAPPFYEVEQYTVMAKAAAQMKDPRALVIVLLGGEAGLRVGEMMALKWSDVNYRARRLTIRASVYQRTVTERFEDVVKGGLEKPIPMSKRLLASLRRLERTKNGDYVLQSDGEPMSWRALAWVIMRVERSVGMPETGRAHVLRHTYCSHLAQAGVPARTIQEMGRHADLSTTMRYMHLAKDAKENAVRDLEKLRAAQR